MDIGTYLPHRAPPYTTSSSPIYTRQGDGVGRSLYVPQDHPGWSEGPFADRTIESLHVSMAQTTTEVKGLATRVESLYVGEAERSEKLNQILARIEEIEARMGKLESAGEGIEMRSRGSSGGSKSTVNEHPSLKVCRDTILP